MSNSPSKENENAAMEMREQLLRMDDEQFRRAIVNIVTVMQTQFFELARACSKGSIAKIAHEVQDEKFAETQKLTSDAQKVLEALMSQSESMRSVVNAATSQENDNG